MAVKLPNFPEFDLNPKDTVTTRWDKWVKKLNNLFLAMDIQDPDRKNAILLHYAEVINDIYDTNTQSPNQNRKMIMKKKVERKVKRKKNL